MKKLFNLITIAFILLLVLMLLAIGKTYGQSGQLVLMQINQERSYNDLNYINYDKEQGKMADKLLDRYMRKGKVSMDKADFCEYYTFEGNKADVEVIIDVACVGEKGWFFEPVTSAVLKFSYDIQKNVTYGIGLYNYE